MNRASTPAGAIAALAFLAALQAGCPSPRSVPIQPDASGTDARTASGSDGPARGGAGGGTGGAGGMDPGTDQATCGADQQACPGLGCVDIKSPEHCGRSCTPCPSIMGGTTTCDGTRCGVSCPMNMQPCLDRCIAVGVVCDDVCPTPMQRACNGVCVELTNLAACGPECTPCPTSPRGKAACNGTSCQLTCDPGYHLCEDSTCRSDRDVKSCGSSCTPCPVPEGGEATCDGTVCGSTCPSGTTLCAGRCIPMSQACNGVCLDGKHDCGGNCVPNDVNFCGPACKQCRPPANADARCDGNDCAFSCRSNHRECDGGCLANDRPCNGSCPGGSKVCGNTCVPMSTCCTDDREGCPVCYGCGGNGTCTRRPDNTACGGDQVCRGGACVACGELGQPCCAGNGCDGNLSCSGGTCRGECTPGQRACQGQVPRSCDGNGQWVDGGRCNGQACVNGGCTGVCEPGTRGCGGNETPQTCNGNGQFANSGSPCAGVCRGEGQCMGQCRPASSPICASNPVRVRRCTSSATFEDQTCEAPAGATPTCAGGTCDFRCPSDRPEKCNGDRECCECVSNGQCNDRPGFTGTCSGGTCSYSCNGAQCDNQCKPKFACAALIRADADFCIQTTACNFDRDGLHPRLGNGGEGVCDKAGLARVASSGGDCSDGTFRDLGRSACSRLSDPAGASPGRPIEYNIDEYDASTGGLISSRNVPGPADLRNCP